MKPNKMLFLLAALVINFSCIANGNNDSLPHGIFDRVEEYIHSERGFKKLDLIDITKVNESSSDLYKYSLFNYNNKYYDNIFNAESQGIEIPIILDGEYYNIVAIPQEIFSSNFVVTSTKDSICRPVDKYSQYSDGLHYVGYLSGYQTSTTVSLSIFKESIWGCISIEGKGNYAISPQYDNNIHVIYNIEDAVNRPEGPFCRTIDPTNVQSDRNIDFGENMWINGICIRVFIDVNPSVYNKLNQNLTHTQQYAKALFAQSASLFLNEDIIIKMSRLNIWLNNSPFSNLPSNSGDRLNNFIIHYQNGFTGDVGVLLDFDDGTYGGLAPRVNVNGIACEDYRNNLCYVGVAYRQTLGASVNTGFNFYIPNYTWQVLVFAHELGHLFGSPHTHACVWNGNNTAIDGCYPVEGNCFQPPSNPFLTIMSYCHLPSAGLAPNGLNFIHGFGIQPGDRIRNRVYKYGCLRQCQKRCTYSHSLYSSLVQNSTFNSTPSIWNASHFVQSQSQYNLSSASSYLEYNAGKYVQLNPGFEAKTSGGVFIAKIGGCTPDIVEISTQERRRNPTENLQNEFVEPANSHDLTLSPNPATNMATLRFSLSQAAPYTIVVLDLTGRALFSSAHSGNKGPNEYSFSVSDLPAGTYLLRVESSGFKEIRRLTVIR